MTWWQSERWRAYEAACGITTGRHEELAAATWRTRVIDLSPPSTELWHGVRKGYRRNISIARGAWDFVTCGSDAMSAFLMLHFAGAGRMTRPATSWAMMGDWVDDGHMLLVGARPRPGRPDVTVQGIGWGGFAAFERDGSWAYYGHAASSVRGLGHALIWTGLVALKASGTTRLEMGWQGQAQPGDEKGQAIEFFRRGFGGHDVPAADGWQQ